MLPHLPNSADSSLRYRYGGIVFLVVVFFLLVFWSWRKWPDPWVDFGRELYVPWQIANGKVLYRDVACVFGPLSSYFNALGFYLLGTSFTTMIVVDLLIIAAITAMIYAIGKATCQSAVAVIVAAMFLCLFCFGQYTLFRNDNFVCPYAHEATHGVALAMAMLFCLCRYLFTAKSMFLGAAGLCLGGTFLTKPEIFVAALGTGISALVILRHDRKHLELGTIYTGMAFFVVAFFLPLLVFFLYFCFHLPILHALQCVAGAWIPIFTSSVTGPFYLDTSGLNNPLGNWGRMLLMFIILACGTGGGVLLDFALRKYPRLSRYSIFVLAVGLYSLLIFLFLSSAYFPLPFSWNLAYYLEKIVPLWNYGIGWALPLTTLTIGVSLSIAYWHARPDVARMKKLLALIWWAIFSLILLAKIALNARIYHYGIYLGMPAALLLAMSWLYLLPKFLAEKYNQGQLFYRLALFTVVLWLGLNLWYGNRFYCQKNLIVGEEHDEIVLPNPGVDPKSLALQYVLLWMDEKMPRNATLAVLPAGAILNYLSRRENPTPYFHLPPLELRRYGEDKVLDAFRQHPPDFLILVHHEELGSFGRSANYGKRVIEWVQGNYFERECIGEDPLHATNFGIKIWQRKEP